MTDDDTRLENALRDALADRTADLEIPSGMGEGGRRIARRRTTRRAMTAAAPVLVAAIVVAVLLTGGRDGPQAAYARDVIRHVRAALTRRGQSDGVQETVTTSEHDWSCTEANGTTYTLSRIFNPSNGKLTQLYRDVLRPLSGGEVSDTQLKILISSRTWDRQRAIKNDEKSHKPNIQSTARKISAARTAT